MCKQGKPNGHWLMRTCVLSSRPPMPLDSAYCNALLLAHWSVRQKLNHVCSIQLHRSGHAFKQAQCNVLRH